MKRSALIAPAAVLMGVLLFAAAGSALADGTPHWRHVGDGTGIMGFLDMSSIVRNGGTATANVMIVEDLDRVAAAGMDHVVVVMGFDCTGHRNQMTHATLYDGSGKVTGDGPMDGVMEAADFDDPETVKMFSIVCDGAPPPAGPEFSSIDSTVAWARTQKH